MLKFWDPRALKFLNYGALGAPKWGGLFLHGTDRARVRKKKICHKAVEFDLAENPIRAAIFIFLGVGEVLGSESHQVIRIFHAQYACMLTNFVATPLVSTD